MDEKKDSLSKQGSLSQMMGVKKIGIAKAKTEAKVNPLPNPNECANRIGIVLDDSGSMGGQSITDAKEGISAFVSSCDARTTSIALRPMNALARPLINQYSLIAIQLMEIGATGGTPLYRTLINSLEDLTINRAVVFSDGSPTDGRIVGIDMEQENEAEQMYGMPLPKKAVLLSRNKKCPVDTVFIGSKDAVSSIEELKLLAELTGGTFLHFEDSEKLKRGFKYLAPAYRALLADPNMKAKVEQGGM